MVPGGSSRPDGSENVGQRGVEGVQGRVTGSRRRGINPKSFQLFSLVFGIFLGTKLNLLAKLSTFAYSMSYIFGKLLI